MTQMTTTQLGNHGDSDMDSQQAWSLSLLRNEAPRQARLSVRVAAGHCYSRGRVVRDVPQARA